MFWRDVVSQDIVSPKLVNLVNIRVRPDWSEIRWLWFSTASHTRILHTDHDQSFQICPFNRNAETEMKCCTNYLKYIHVWFTCFWPYFFSLINQDLWHQCATLVGLYPCSAMSVGVIFCIHKIPCWDLKWHILHS